MNDPPPLSAIRDPDFLKEALDLDDPSQDRRSPSVPGAPVPQGAEVGRPGEWEA